MKILIFPLSLLPIVSVCASEPVMCEHDGRELLDALHEVRREISKAGSTESINANLEMMVLLGKYQLSLSPPFEEDINKVTIATGCQRSISYCEQVFLYCSVPLLSGNGSCNTESIGCGD